MSLHWKFLSAFAAGLAAGVVILASRHWLGSDADASTSLTGDLALLLVGLGALVAFYLWSRGNLTAVLSLTELDAESDLADRDDELGKFARTVQQRFNQLAELKESGKPALEKLVTLREQLVSCVDDLGNVQQGHSGVGKIANSTKRLSDALSSIINEAEQSTQASREIFELVDNGRNVINETGETVSALSKDIQHTSEQIAELQRQSNNIGRVLDVIREIAERTNLLALNAAIEAARAGDKGRGFAIVADEVRALANRTQESTDEISAIIDELQKGSERSVNAMAKGCSQAETSEALTTQTCEVLDNVSESVKRIEQLSDDTRNALREQESTANDLRSALSELNNSSSVENGAVDSVNRQLKSLDLVIAELNRLFESSASADISSEEVASDHSNAA